MGTFGFDDSDKPTLLKAIELIIADPAEIQSRVRFLERQYSAKYAGQGGGGNGHDGGGSHSGEDGGTNDAVRELIVHHIVSSCAKRTTLVGASTALTGVIPGLGTVVSSVGGATADLALSMKYNIEMVMALATLFGYDITDEDNKYLCFAVAGLGVLNKAAKEGATATATRAGIRLTERYLKGEVLTLVRQIFRQIGITFTRKGLVKVIPFGVGVLIGAGINNRTTWYLGRQAKNEFRPVDGVQVSA